MPRPRKYSDKLVLYIQKTYNKGQVTYQDLADEHKLSIHQIQYILTNLEVKPSPSSISKEPMAREVFTFKKEPRIVEATVTLKPTEPLKKVVMGNSMENFKSRRKSLSFFNWVYKWFGLK